MSHDEARRLAAADQALATLADTLPAPVFRFFENLLTAGFKRPEALKLTEVYLRTILADVNRAG